MNSSLIHLLVTTTIASSFSVLIVAGLRKPLRHLAGARAAYWIWLLVPASIVALCLPGPSHSVRIVAGGLQAQSTAALSSAILSVDTAIRSSNFAVAVVSVWLVGVAVMLGLLFHRQLVFVRGLGSLTPDSGGILQSASISAPLLLGVWHARIVVPVDFSTRYSSEERALVLAHERAHAARRDIAVNALASLWLCLAWFNPLMYWAIGRLRFDQDLACDAIVLAASKTSRGRYAKALLKSQLAGELKVGIPLGCHWQSTHPLKERISMLKYPFAGTARRTIGIVFAVSVALAGSYAAWATQSDVPTAPTAGKLIAINMRWWVNGKDVLHVSGPIASQDIRVASGSEFVEKVSFGPDQSFETRCFASLSNQDRESSIWGKVQAAGQSIQGLILFECKLSTNDKPFSTPALLVGDGKVGTIETTNPQGNVHYKLELRASALPPKTAMLKAL